jgi:simple sugar transport system permease protein
MPLRSIKEIPLSNNTIKKISKDVPYQLFQMIPYICTLAALTVMGAKKAGPKAKGQPYLREER